MASFEDHLQAAEARRQRKAELARQEREAQIREAARDDARAQIVRERANALVPEIRRAVESLKTRGRRPPPGRPSEWIFYSGGNAYVTVAVAVSVDGHVTVVLKGHEAWQRETGESRTLSLTDFVEGGIHRFFDGGLTYVDKISYAREHLIEADETLERALAGIADYLTAL